ncbi:hypothetical protein ES705_51059 [subsurface metagenome]
METKTYICHLCKIPIRARIDLVRAVRNHMKAVHSKLAGAVLSDEEILGQENELRRSRNEEALGNSG